MVKVMRIDDVCANTKMRDFSYQLDIIRDKGFKIIAGVNIFSKGANNGAVYPDLPLKNNSFEYFLDVDRFTYREQLRETGLQDNEIVSHGIVHADHSKMSKDAQELSIITSCQFLRTDTFIPPFNRYNDTTLDICKKHNIELIRNTDTVTWHSLETEEYTNEHTHWYYHPWRVNSDELAKKLCNG